MLAFDPNKRPTASQCMQHPYFTAYTKGEYAKRTANFVEENKQSKPPIANQGFLAMKQKKDGKLGNSPSKGHLGSNPGVSPLASNPGISPLASMEKSSALASKNR